MPKRFTDTDLWDQDWYADMPNKYKLFWSYIRDRCDAGGVWRPNVTTINAKLKDRIKLDEFLLCINADKERIAVLPNGRWLIKGFVSFQYGKKFSDTSKVHIGALRCLIENDVDISQIPGWDNSFLHTLDNHQLNLIGYGKPMDSLSIGYGKPMVSPKEKELELLRENIGDKDKRKHRRNSTDDTIQDTREKKIEDDTNEVIPSTDPPKEDEQQSPPKEQAPPKISPPIVDTTPPRSFNPNIVDGQYQFKPSARGPRPKQSKQGFRYPWDSQKFKDQWEIWLDYQWERAVNDLDYPYRGSFSEQAAVFTLSDLACGKEEDAYRIITHSIANNYKSFIKPKNDTDNGNWKPGRNGQSSGPDPYDEHKRGMAERFKKATGQTGHVPE